MPLSLVHRRPLSASIMPLLEPAQVTADGTPVPDDKVICPHATRFRQRHMHPETSFSGTMTVNTKEACEMVLHIWAALQGQHVMGGLARRRGLSRLCIMLRPGVNACLMQRAHAGLQTCLPATLPADLRPAHDDGR